MTGKAISVDLRERAVRMVDQGASRHAAARRFGVSVSSVVRWVQRSRTRGDLTPDKRGGNRRSHRIDAHWDLILGWIEAAPDLTLAEIAGRLEALGCRTFPSVVHGFFRRHGVTRKKDRACGGAEPRRRSRRAARVGQGAGLLGRGQVGLY